MPSADGVLRSQSADGAVGTIPYELDFKKRLKMAEAEMSARGGHLGGDLAKKGERKKEKE